MTIIAAESIFAWVIKMKTDNEELLLKAHHYSSGNKPALEKDELCGCFYCLKVLSPKEITEYIQNDDVAIDKEGTALCPYCGVDSVLPQSSGFPLTNEFLKRMHRKWF